MTTSRSRLPVSTRIGSVFPRIRNSWRTWKPSRLLSPMSSRSRSNSSLSPSACACSPSPVRNVVKPFARNPFSRKDPISGSSSAIRMRGIVLSVGRVARNDDREGRPLVEAALQLDPAVVSLGDGLDVGEAEPASAVAPAGLSSAGEAIEDPLLLGEGNARAGVPDPDQRLVVGEGRPDRDRVVGLGVLEGIVGEVHDGLGEAVAGREDGPPGGVVERPPARPER